MPTATVDVQQYRDDDYAIYEGTQVKSLVLGAVELLAASTVAVLAVVWFRDRLLRFAANRRLRFAGGVILVLLQLVAAILTNAIDFRGSVQTLQLFPADVATFQYLVGVVTVMLALQMFVLLHADFAEIERGALANQLHDARRDFRFTSHVSNTFVRVVSRKRERLSTASDSAALLAALNPQLQLAALIAASWEVVNSMINADGGDHRVRVAYYRCAAKRLVLAHCWNGTASDCVPQWDESVQRRFRLNDPNGCLAVAAAKDGAMYRVPSTAQADVDPLNPFAFFAESERDELKSIVAIPIKIEGGSTPHPVLVIDTSREGFFNDEDRRQELQLQQVIFHLAHRLHLEEKVSTVLGGN